VILRIGRGVMILLGWDVMAVVRTGTAQNRVRRSSSPPVSANGGRDAFAAFARRPSARLFQYSLWPMRALTQLDFAIAGRAHAQLACSLWPLRVVVEVEMNG